MIRSSKYHSCRLTDTRVQLDFKDVATIPNITEPYKEVEFDFSDNPLCAKSIRLINTKQNTRLQVAYVEVHGFADEDHHDERMVQGAY